jgi:hypothetical protein
MSYTKGEWKTEKQIETGYNEIVSGAVSIGIIHGDNNARLISASPDLLEACKLAEQMARDYGEDCLADILASAINNAEGNN